MLVSSSFFLYFKREHFTRPVDSQQPPAAGSLGSVAVFQLRPHSPWLAPSDRLSMTMVPGPGHFCLLRYSSVGNLCTGVPHRVNRDSHSCNIV